MTLTLNKPAYIEMCILELNKLLMYEFHYDYIKNKCGKISILLFTDTDILMYEIKTEDVYVDFSNGKEMFYFSNYLSKSKYYDNLYKLVAGKMKDETAIPVIGDFLGLKSKVYLYLVNDQSEHKKAKGVNRKVLGTISHNKYKDVLLKENVWGIWLIGFKVKIIN